MVASLDIDVVEIRGGPLVLASDAEVDEIQDRLGVEFPDGYREYVTRLGEGSLNVFVRVLPPWRILAELDEHRGMMSAYWFWESGKVPFGQEEAIDSIQIADTFDGDVIVFHPADRARLIILPRNRDRLYARGPDFLETINWVCSGGAIRRFGLDRYFEPSDSRLEGGGDVAAKASPTNPSASFAPKLPGLDRTPREVLMSYFAELRTVEEWALAKAGGPEAFLRDEPPDIGPEELLARSAEVHSRYCTPTLATALSGASVAISSPPEHDPGAIRVLGEIEERPGRVVIRTAEGTYEVWTRQYRMERTGGSWRITSRTDLGVEVSTGSLRSRLRRRFRSS